MVYYWVYHIIMFLNQWLVPSRDRDVSCFAASPPRAASSHLMRSQKSWCCRWIRFGQFRGPIAAIATGLANSPRWNWSSEIQIDDRVETWVVLNDFGIRSSQPTLMDQDLNRQAEVLPFSRCNAVSIIHSLVQNNFFFAGVGFSIPLLIVPLAVQT